MEFKGTKGKWILRENKSTVVSDEQCLVARVFDGKGYALLDDKQQSEGIVEANALLMSKAPELLEMLSRVVYMTSVCEGTFADFRERYNVEIEQLIKQATDINYAKEDTNR